MIVTLKTLLRPVGLNFANIINNTYTTLAKTLVFLIAKLANFCYYWQNLSRHWRYLNF